VININRKLNTAFQKISEPLTDDIYGKIQEELNTALMKVEEQFGAQQTEGDTHSEDCDIYTLDSETEDGYDVEIAEENRQDVDLHKLYRRFRSMKKTLDAITMEPKKT
ncbi:unnamed protein product, partial [Meganyctiphanes norvegica]